MKHPITQEAVSRIKYSTAKKNGGSVPKDSFAARIERASAKISGSKGKPKPPNGPSKTGKPSGTGRGNNPAKPKKK